MTLQRALDGVGPTEPRWLAGSDAREVEILLHMMEDFD